MEQEALVEKMVEYRARHNLSQGEFANLCKLCTQTISNIETGVQRPSRFTKCKILTIIENKGD